MECLLVGYNADYISIQGHLHADCVGDDSTEHVCPSVGRGDDPIAFFGVCGVNGSNVFKGFGIVHPVFDVCGGFFMSAMPRRELGLKFLVLLLYSRGARLCLLHSASNLSRSRN